MNANEKEQSKCKETAEALKKLGAGEVIQLIISTSKPVSISDDKNGIYRRLGIGSK